MSACIEHNQRGNAAGYGTTRHHGKTEYMHRVAYCNAHLLPITAIRGLLVLHTCDNPRCYNPQHLRVGTAQDNSTDMLQKGRHRVLRGELHPSTKLTQGLVDMIRRVYTPRSRMFGARALARQLNVSEVTVRDVLKGRTWA